MSVSSRIEGITPGRYLSSLFNRDQVVFVTNELVATEEEKLKEKSKLYGALQVAYLQQSEKPLLPVIHVGRQLQILHSTEPIRDSNQLYTFLVNLFKEVHRLNSIAVVDDPLRQPMIIYRKAEPSDIDCLLSQIKAVETSQQYHSLNMRSLQPPTDEDLYGFLLSKDRTRINL